MIGTYVGYVNGEDRLHGFLSRIIYDELGMREAHPAFRAFRLNGSNEVYGYEEKSSRARVICSASRRSRRKPKRPSPACKAFAWIKSSPRPFFVT